MELKINFFAVAAMLTAAYPLVKLWLKHRPHSSKES
jgi:hypothetical protein